MKNTLWNTFESNDFYSINQEKRQEHLLEQYKIYVEMADRISARRNLANTFFLTINTLILSATGFIFEKIHLIEPRWLVIFPFIGIILICVVWIWLITSYRNLNSAKYEVIGDMETQLPASPYGNAEWVKLGSGKDFRKYLPLTTIEIYIPILFSLTYLIILIYILGFA